MGNEASKGGTGSASGGKSRTGGGSATPGMDTTSPSRQPPAAYTSSVPVSSASAPRPVSRPSPNSPSNSTPRGLSASPSAVMSSELSASVPRYVDARSMVYASASVPDQGGCSQGLMSPSASFRAARATSTSEFLIGSPGSPLSPSRRHTFSATTSAPLATAPIAIPTYNPEAGDVAGVSSPMLRSYRQSFSVGKGSGACLATSPTSPSVHTFTGVSPTSPGMSFHMAGAAFDSASPASKSTSQSQSHVHGSATGAASAGAGGMDVSQAPIHGRFLEITGYPLGLENYGNTCYCNSVLQLLYHCTPLRLRLLELNEIYSSKKGGVGFEESTVLFHLCHLMALMHKSNNRRKDKRKEVIAPSALLRCVREKNATFNNREQQDAHEFLMFVVSDIIDTEKRMMTDPKNRALFADELKKKKSSMSFWKSSSSSGGGGGATSSGATTANAVAAVEQWTSSTFTPLQAIVQGQFGSLTACLECNNITARDEVFIDLCVETTQGASLPYCLAHFSDPEYFYGKNKLRCDRCKAPVRAAMCLHVERLPAYNLIIQLKRFQYDVSKQTFTKKADHVALPMSMDVEEYQADLSEPAHDMEDLELPPAGGPAPAKDDKDSFKPAPLSVLRKLKGIARHKARFELAGFVAHIGEGPSLGHYFTCIRYGPQMWRRFDDDTVSTMTEREVQQYFGVPINVTGVVTTTAYILLYERVA